MCLLLKACQKHLIVFRYLVNISAIQPLPLVSSITLLISLAIYIDVVMGLIAASLIEAFMIFNILEKTISRCPPPWLWFFVVEVMGRLVFFSSTMSNKKYRKLCTIIKERHKLHIGDENNTDDGVNDQSKFSPIFTASPAVRNKRHTPTIARNVNRKWSNVRNPRRECGCSISVIDVADRQQHQMCTGEIDWATVYLNNTLPHSASDYT